MAKTYDEGARDNGKKDRRLLEGGRSFSLTLGICVLVFAVAIAMLIFSFNHLIRQHDRKLSGEVCSLISEKVNNSIHFMTVSARDISRVIDALSLETPREVYDVLQRTEGGAYVSAGFIDARERLYATEEERAEFGKWELLATARRAAPVSISAPYRSAATGQPVFTMFTDVTYGDGQEGCLFLTYLLKEIQSVAATETLSGETEVWLMDAESANIIRCAGGDVYAVGSWANAYLALADMAKEDKPAYEEWRQRMVGGVESAVLNYHIGDVLYTQCCSAIVDMPGWYVVVRIPSSALSATMKTFRNYVLVFLIVLLAVVSVLFVITYRRNTREKKLLEQLSVHDPLTGLLNRRAFDFAAEERLSFKRDAVLVFFDVDFFKQVNDRFGHDGGDRILVAFAAALKKRFGERGAIARYGGDEFVALLDMPDQQTLDWELSELKKEVHAIRPTDDEALGQGFVLSFSAGASRFPADAANFHDLKKNADAALYQVKENGRDGYRWHAAGPQP